jgi:very-short-patch-repair endonuclease
MSIFKKKNIQTQNEAQFFECLQKAFPNYYIGIQVSMSAIVESEYKNRSQFRNYYNDFVICDKKGIMPIMVIELDDNTHKKEKRIEQDIRKNTVLSDANILLCRYTAKKIYTIEEIKNEIEPILSGKIKPPEYPINKGKKLSKTGCFIPMTLAATTMIVIIMLL